MLCLIWCCLDVIVFRFHFTLVLIECLLIYNGVMVVVFGIVWVVCFVDLDCLGCYYVVTIVEFALCNGCFCWLFDFGFIV